MQWFQSRLGRLLHCHAKRCRTATLHVGRFLISHHLACTSPCTCPMLTTQATATTHPPVFWHNTSALPQPTLATRSDAQNEWSGRQGPSALTGPPPKSLSSTTIAVAPYQAESCSHMHGSTLQGLFAQAAQCFATHSVQYCPRGTDLQAAAPRCDT